VGAAIEAGEYGAALAAWEEGIPLDFLLAGANRRGKALAVLRASLGRADGRRADPGVLSDLARALSAAGFEQEAAFVAARALSLAPESRDLMRLAADLDSWARFLAGVRETFRRGYRGFQACGEGADVEAALVALRGLSMRCLGRDVLRGVRVKEYPFAGSVARTDRPGVTDEWAERGALLVLGQRPGGPPDATLLRLVGSYPEVEERGVAYTLSLGEDRSLRSFGERAGGGVAGFTLPGWVLLNLDVLASVDEEARTLAASAADRPLWPALDDERRTSLWFSQGVRARLARRLLSRPAGGGSALVSVLTHELGHLLDADRWIPFGKNLPALVWQVARHGFSISSIEVTLERDAEAYALRNAPRPRSVLLNTTAYLPFRTSGPPHSVAYHDLLRQIVTEIDDDPDGYPSIDRRFNILGQLDRLSDAELAALLPRALD
jgi:hypothetical protein